MLRDNWNIRLYPQEELNMLWIFTSKDDEKVTISLRAYKIEDAWEKLGALLGKEDKENVETEVFEGVVKTYIIRDFLIGDIKSDDKRDFNDSLVEHEGKRVKVTMEIQP